MNGTAVMVADKLNPLSKLKSWLFGGPGAIVLAILAAYFALFKGQAGVLQLLQSWGPSFPIILVCIGIVGVYLGMQNDNTRDFFQKFVEVQRDTAVAYGVIAESLRKIAEKDDRQMQEMQTLTSYTAQQSERLAQRMVTLAEKMDEVNEKLGANHRSEFEAINKKLDAMAGVEKKA